MTRLLKELVMEFSLHHLSGTNLASIFNAALIDAEPLDDDFCLVKKQYPTSIWANTEDYLLQFSTYKSLYSLSEGEVKSLVHQLNNNIQSIKASYDNCSNPVG